MHDEGQTRRYVLVFDGHCRICRRSIRWIRARDREDLIELLPYQDPSVAERFPHVPAAAFEEAIQLIGPGGERLEGARAVEEILRLIPGARIVAPAFRIPGVRPLAEWVYGLVARNRRHFGCAAHCSAPNAKSRLDG